MKSILSTLFSSKSTIILLFLLAISLATATFIEDKFDTNTAKILVYNAKWFEFIFLLLIINFIGHIGTHKMLNKEKLAGFIFHIAFILMILGAGVTRYFSFEGNMHIRQGESSNVMVGSTPNLIISMTDGNEEFNYEKPLLFSPVTNNSFDITIQSKSKGEITVEYNNYIKNAVEKVQTNVDGGVNIIELIVFTHTGRNKVYVKSGEIKELNGLNISYNSKNNNSINIIDSNGGLKISAPFDLFLADMQEEQIQDTIKKDSIADFNQSYAYNSANAAIVLTTKHKNAKVEMVSGEPEESKVDALLLDVTVNGKKETVSVLGGSYYEANMQAISVNGAKLNIGYGCKVIQLPFSLKLNDFILERYPGSMSPSSYASEVTLIDTRNNLNENHRIFMNNVLDYAQYRFFQSSYDQDEKGTILSVNHDFYGTWFSYFGYTLLTLGFILTLINKKSRFITLSKNIGELSKKRKAGILTIAFVLTISTFGFSQNSSTNSVSEEQAEKFGHLLVQTYDGRFEPLNSLTYDIMHKISRKDKFEVIGNGTMNAMQALIDMLIEPEFWKEQKIIYVREQSVRDAIGINEKYASFKDFFDNDQKYKLEIFANKAFQKKQSEQNTFDKEIIKVDERVNIFMMVLRGSILKIFPVQNSPENKWISLDDKLAITPLTGSLKIINDDLQLANFNYSGIFAAYLMELKSGNVEQSDKILKYISGIQRSTSIVDTLPSESKINVEIFYNNAQIFIFLKNLYAGLSVLLLFLAFIDTLKSKKNKILSYSFNFLMALLVLGFAYHTLGMILRWYLTGHAPWSNGYEALILISWGSLLAGFIFVKYSKITLATTVLLAFFTLMTASHSSYDPQLTNLQPVLKSYWLIIHVATLTISYGFLGLAFFLGIINMCIMIFKNNKNHFKLNLIVKELTYISEMNIIIGLVLATVGTFLGGVWANESWGRYWGWDAKETWALIIVITYTIVLHFRFIPKFNNSYVFNVSSIIGFSSVLMTFIGVNYYLSKGMHSYGAGETPLFPIWAWVVILSVIALIVIAGIKEKINSKYLDKN